jgi:hypothetical protein
MSEGFYNDYLYPLQDEALKIIKEADTAFYLTGGTASGRCYLHHRYSDDLDLFQNRSASFSTDSLKIIDRLGDQLIIRPTIKDESFYRIFLTRSPGDPELKIEFVNDIGYHAGDFTIHAIFHRVDSWKNILSNKISALSRNEPKDIADILFISIHFPFSWKEIFSDVRKKDAWINEIVASQYIYDFDPKMLKNVKWIDRKNFDRDFSTELKTIARELLHGFDNSLFNKFR